MTEINQQSALLYLLEDPDEQVFQQIKSKLVTLGDEMIPKLEEKWESSANDLVQERIEDILHLIHFRTFCYKLEHWVQTEKNNLLSGVFLACAYAFPNLNNEDILMTIRNIVMEISEAIEGLPARKTIKKFNQFFFTEYGFRVVNKEGLSLHPFFPSQLISSRKGEVIAVAIVYLLIARELSLPISLLNVSKERCLLSFNDKKNNQFYFIDPAKKGVILPKKEVERRFFDDTLLDWFTLHPLNNIEIITLLFVSISKIYENTTHKKRTEIDQILSILRT